MRDRRALIAAACLLMLAALAGCASPRVTAPRAAPTPPLPPSADGLAFVHDGAVYVVRDGSANKLAAGAAEKAAVCYTEDDGRLLVTEVRGTMRAVTMVALDRGGRARDVLDSGDGSNLGAVRAVVKKDRLYRAVYGSPGAQLVVSGLEPGSRSATLALGGTFSGEYDVDAAGTSIVYTGAGQNPAVLTIRTGSIERPLVSGMATAFTPSFSYDGRRVCFTGSERAGDPLSVYVVDTHGGPPRAVAGTDRLQPTSPVFSPDDRSLAFRSALDGALWVASRGGGEPERLDAAADDLPISW